MIAILCWWMSLMIWIRICSNSVVCYHHIGERTVYLCTLIVLMFFFSLIFLCCNNFDTNGLNSDFQIMQHFTWYLWSYSRTIWSSTTHADQVYYIFYSTVSLWLLIRIHICLVNVNCAMLILFLHPVIKIL